MTDLTPEKRAALRQTLHYSGQSNFAVERDTIAALLDAADERDWLAAAVGRVRALAEWHETESEKARRFRIEINGEIHVMDKAADVHYDAAARLRRALDGTDDGPTPCVS